MGRKDKEPKKNDFEDMKRDQKLQAILLADSFKKTFRPMTYESPKALMPLVNVPMIMYTIEFLAQNGVEEIFIFCVKHTELMEQYINSLHLPTNLNVRCITSSSCLTQGDALREIDSMNLIRSDPFIMINGDVISNMNLSKAIAFHKERRRADPNAIMTLTMKEVTKHSGLRSISDDLVVAVDSNTSQIVLFDNSISETAVQLPKEVIFDHNSIDIRTDLLDCQIDICSPELLLQFSDNFDYQDIRKHFIQSEVVNWELGQHLFAYVIQSEYAARVHDPRTYDNVSRDVISRWVYPMVPDAHLLADFSYTQHKHFIYKENNVKVARSARVGKCVVLGRGTVLEEGVQVSNCVIGPNCTIKKGAQLSHCHLWENVVVESNVNIVYSIVGDRCVLKEGACIGRGSLLSGGVVIGKGVEIPPYSRLSSKHVTSCSDDDESDSDESSGDSEGDTKSLRHPYDSDVVGSDGVGYLWKFDGDEVAAEFGFDEDSDDDLDNDDNGTATRAHMLPTGSERVEALWATSMGCKEQEAWKHHLWSTMEAPVEEEDSDEESESDGDEQEGGMNTSRGDDGKMEYAVDPFTVSVSEWIVTGHEQNDSADNLLLEIKGLKFAQNKEYNDCIRGVIAALLKIVKTEFDKSGSSSAMNMVSIFKSFFDAGKWGYIMLQSLIQGEDEELCVIESVLEFVLIEGSDHVMYTSFRLLLQMLYDVDLISEEVLLQWASTADGEQNVANDFDDVQKIRHPAVTPEARKTLMMEPQLREFIEWLQEEDDESDDDDDDDDSD
mmetsp:Transcript_23428/g.39739  ORF Transcript_23428/g.39739 Transcript_23428/m.39739 type:complete len:780 (+) Transcript_23428:64-2403(+)